MTQGGDRSGQGSEDAGRTRDLEERKIRHKVMDQVEENRGETERLEKLKKNIEKQKKRKRG